MPHRYAPLPNSHSPSRHERQVEMEAAFDYSEDEDDVNIATESQPLNPEPTSPQRAPPSLPVQHSSRTYNFEAVDYDGPPPGSPPPPSATSLPNNIGNSNGLIPDFTNNPPNRGPRRMWFQRGAAAVLPSSLLSRIGITSERPRGPVGGGTNNDGVFANVTAKPTPPVRIQNGDDTYLVPEDTRDEAPPSYASAQADAVPPYWETTVHAPFAPDSIGDIVIDNLPTGSFFAFCWNLLVSVSFQFIGFLLTYLLHTSHAARFGSRAGLGVTLIQYGFALRSRLDSADEVNKDNWVWSGPDDGRHVHRHEHHHNSASNTTWPTAAPNATQEQVAITSDATTEWLSFFLMTIGWFLLLTSILGFWRVKRWEREISSSRRASSSTATHRSPINQNLASHLESSFGLRGISRVELLRQGLGFGGQRASGEDPSTREVSRAEEVETERDPMLIVASTDPERSRAIAAALENEARLRRDLRDAGFL